MEYPDPALYILESQSHRTFIQLVEIVLRNAAAIVVDADKEFSILVILRDMYKTGVAVFEDIIHEFLNDPEYQQFLFRFHAGAVIMEPARGINRAGSADFLEKVVNG